jgi:hypothetical protein
MRRLPFQFFTSVVLAAFVICVVPAHAQLPILSSDVFLTTPDNVSIHVHRKVIGSVGGGFAGASVLLVHGTFGDARTWDFPGRSVMDRLASEGYDVYALDLRGMGSSEKPANYFTIDIVNRVTDVATVAGYILAGLDPLVGKQSSQALFNALTGTTNKHLVIFPFNSHGGFLEDNHDITMLAVDLFLLQFRSPTRPHD